MVTGWCGHIEGIADASYWMTTDDDLRRATTLKVTLTPSGGANVVQQATAPGFPMVDCQMNTHHLASLGAREIRRSDFLRRVSALVNYSEPPGRWQFTDRQARRLDEAQCQD